MSCIWLSLKFASTQTSCNGTMESSVVPSHLPAMKTFFRTILFSSLMISCANSYALSENEAEDMADLTAVFVFLKNDCGYQNLPNGQIRRALVFFAQQNQWDLSNYDSFDMKALGEDSYRDLSGIGIPTAKKCKALARDSLSLLAYVK
jgi:hypothetical protein